MILAVAEAGIHVAQFRRKVATLAERRVATETIVVFPDLYLRGNLWRDIFSMIALREYLHGVECAKQH